MFITKTFKRFLSMALTISIILTLIPSVLANDIDPSKAKFEFELYKYNEPTNGDNIGTLGDKLIPDSQGKVNLVKGQKFVAKVIMDNFEKQYGFAGIEYSFGYDKSSLTLITAKDTTSGSHVDNSNNSGLPTEFNKFQNDLWNKFNPNGKFNPENTQYDFSNIVDSTPIWPSQIQGQNEIRVYGVTNTDPNSVSVPSPQLFKGDSNDKTVGVFLFQVNTNSTPSQQDLPPLKFYEDNASVDLAWYNSNVISDTKHVIKGGQGEEDFDNVFNPPINPPIIVPDLKDVYIESVGPIVTSSDNPLLNNVNNLDELKNQLLPSQVYVVNKKDGTKTLKDANWEAISTDNFNPKGGKYIYKTKVVGLPDDEQLLKVEVIITPVYAIAPLDVKSQTILVKDVASITTFDQLKSMFPSESGKVIYVGAQFVDLNTAPDYSIAYSPNQLPADWTTATKGDTFDYIGTVTLSSSLPRWVTDNTPKSIDIKVLIDDLSDIIITPNPLPEYPDDPNTTDLNDKFNGYMTSADNPILNDLDTVEKFNNKFLPKLVEARRKKADGTTVHVGYVIANWQYIGNLQGDGNNTVNYKKESYRYKTNVADIKPDNQANAKIVVTPVTGELPIQPQINLFFDQNSVNTITDFDKLKTLLQQPGNLKLTGALTGTRVQYEIVWNPNTLPNNFTTVSKTHNFTGQISSTSDNYTPLTLPRWLTGTIPNSVIANVEVTLDKTITGIVDSTKKSSTTSADDNRINTSKEISEIIRLLPQYIEVTLNDSTTKFVSANWNALTPDDTKIDLKGKTYNFKSNITSLPQNINQLDGEVIVTSVTAEPNSDYKPTDLKFPKSKLKEFNQILNSSPKNSNFINMKGNIASTQAPIYIIDWNTENLINLQPDTIGSTGSMQASINPLSALWLTFTDNHPVVNVTIVDGPSIELNGNTIDQNNSDVYMYVQRGFRDTGWTITNHDGSEFNGKVSVVRKSYIVNSDSTTYQKELSSYTEDENITIDTTDKNLYGKYIIKYKFTIDGEELEKEYQRNVNIIYLRGDINKDGIVNGTNSDKTENTDMGLFNMIIKRKAQYDNSSNDVDYIANIVKTITKGQYPSNLDGNPTMIFKVHNQEKLEKYAKKIPVVEQYFDFLINTETAYENTK